MPLRNPDSLESFGIGEASPFDQQFVFARRIRGLVGAEIGETEGKWPVRVAPRRTTGRGAGLFALAKLGFAAGPESRRDRLLGWVAIRGGSGQAAPHGHAGGGLSWGCGAASPFARRQKPRGAQLRDALLDGTDDPFEIFIRVRGREKTVAPFPDVH